MQQQLDDLVFDRTGADVARVKSVIQAIVAGTATEEEKAEFVSCAMKGAYNYTDLNRVGEAVEYLTEILNGLGYETSTEPKTDWTESDIPTLGDMERYIEDIHTLRNRIPYIAQDVPDNINKMTYQQANDIEEILHTLERVLRAMEKHFKLRQANTIFMTAGGVMNA